MSETAPAPQTHVATPMRVETHVTNPVGVKIHVANPMGFDGIGPSQTCLSIAEAAGRQGTQVHLYGTRRTRIDPQHSTLTTPWANLMAKVPYRYTAPLLMRAAERLILRRTPEGATVYAWPALDADVMETLRGRGCRMGLEMINILTMREKELIEAEMEREDFRYPHYVTPDKTENQRRLLAMADTVFVSNRHAAASLKGTLPDGVPVIQTRYGVSTRQARADYATKGERPVFAFVGRVNLEKGVHLLLRAWEAAGLDAELHLYGALDPLFAARYPDLLALPGVRLMGFTRDITRVYRAADGFVFFSLAEGGPLVTLEAAAQGLPLLVSPMGEGGLAEDGVTARVVDPYDTASAAAALRQLATDAALREHLGRAAYARSAEFTWDVAAAERLAGFAALT